MKELSHGVLIYNNGKSFKSDQQVAVLDCNNQCFFHGIIDTILKSIGDFDQDNPAANNTKPLKQMRNTFFCFQNTNCTNCTSKYL